MLITVYKNFKVNLAMLALVAQLQPTLYDPPNFCSPPSSSAHGILQAKTLEWLNILFSRGSFQSRNRTRVSHFGRFFTIFTILYQGSLCNVITYLTPGKGMATTPVSLPRKSHGQKSPAGSSPWGHKSWTQLNNESTTNHEERKQWLVYKQGWFSYSRRMPFSSSSLLKVTM